MAKLYINAPTWTGVLPIYFSVIENIIDDVDEGRNSFARHNHQQKFEVVQKEFERMAEAADKWNAYQADLKAEVDGYIAQDKESRA